VIGRTLGPYRIEALLGRGGMGTVYRAAVSATGEQVALKVLASDAALDARATERFRQEAELLAALRHPNIVTIRGELSREGEHAFYAMELVEGRSLAKVLLERGRLESEAAVALAHAILEGLEAAHASGVIHRDVKPSNVLLARDGSVRVVDFGLARALDATRLTLSGQALGTPAYMSPEQANAQPLDPRTDVYSAGVLLWELLAGKPPFAEGSPLAILRQHVEAPVPPLPVPVAPGLEGVVRQALSKDPNRRFATAGQFGSALAALGLASREVVLAELAGVAETAVLASGPAAGSTVGEARGLAEPETRSRMAPSVTRPPGRRRGFFVVVLVAAVVLGLAGLVARSWFVPARPLVRIETTDGNAIEGRLLQLDRDGARVESLDGTERSVPRARIRRLAYR
jgi:serine/threonine-protein kinase